MVYKVIQWATGSVGTQSLRAIVANPRYELVGAFSYHPAKERNDIGELCGIGPVGITATTRIEDVLAMDADCVAYNALGDMVDPGKALDDICRLLESGKNVVSTAVSTHIHPGALSPDDRKKLDEACVRGGTTFHGTGVNPGFAFDAFPISVSAIANRIDTIEVLELVDMSEYTSKEVVSDMIGMGLAHDTLAPMDYLDDLKYSPYFPCVQLLADAMDLRYEEFRIDRDKAVTPIAVELPWGRIDAGTVAAKRIRMEAICGGVTRVVYEMVWRVSEEAAPDWPSGKAFYELTLRGDPTIRCRLDIDSATGRGTSVATAMHAVNAIPTVCAAPPGIKTVLDLPFAGGGFLPRPGTLAASSEPRTER